MSTLVQKTVEDICAALPAWTPFEEFANRSVFIGAIGFEDRSTSVFSDWAAKNPGGDCVLISYPTNQSENKLNHNTFCQLSSRNCIRPRELTYNRRTFLTDAVAQLAKIEEGKPIVLDISSMASFVLYPILEGLFTSRNEHFVTIVYTEAAVYYPDKNEWDRFWDSIEDRDLVQRAELLDRTYFQSKGEDEVFEHPSFIGTNPDSLPGMLVMVPNFAFHRTFHMVEHVCNQFSISKSQIHWILGRPPDKQANGWRRNAIYKLIGKPSNTLDSDTLDYKDIIINLHGLWERSFGSRSVYIGTLGSKAQHLGTFFFLKMHPEISLTLSEPSEFVANRFSTGIGRRWYAEFGSNTALGTELARWNRLEFAWDEPSE